MGKTLIAYFSATGTTEKVARKVAEATHADLFEIEPAVPYTAADLNWNDRSSRSSIEMNDKSFRPEVKSRVKNMSQYDTILLGFPIWWYVAPTIVNTFLEGYDLAGKTIIPFATSGSSGMGSTNAELAGSCPGAKLREGKRLSSPREAEKWVAGLGL